MGKPMSATPTPESMVGQGGANTPENRCPTTPPLKGGRGWWGVHHLFGVGWGKSNQSRSINDNAVVCLRRTFGRCLAAWRGAGCAADADLVPMPPFLSGQGTGGRGHAFALCGLTAKLPGEHRTHNCPYDSGQSANNCCDPRCFFRKAFGLNCGTAVQFHLSHACSVSIRHAWIGIQEGGFYSQCRLGLFPKFSDQFVKAPDLDRLSILQNCILLIVRHSDRSFPLIFLENGRLPSWRLS